MFEAYVPLNIIYSACFSLFYKSELDLVCVTSTV